MAASDAIPYALTAGALVIVALSIGRRPFVILGRRLTGRTALRPPGTEPGAERWFALGGVVTFLGIGVAALVSRAVGYSIAAIGLLALAYTGALIAFDHRGAARAFARRAWSDFGISVRDPVGQAQVIGAGMVVVAIGGVLVVLREAFR